MVSIELKNISKTYRKKQIIENVSIKFRYDEIFGLLGPNGIGKTTLLKIMTGLIKPSKGRVLVDNYYLDKDFKLAIRKVGAIIENPGLYYNLTGMENLEIHRKMFFQSIKKSRILDLIELLKIDHYIKNKVKTYSMGMKQKVGLAIALIGKPKILILDEPTNGLDPEGVEEFNALLKSLVNNEKSSIILSSHQLSDIEGICDRFTIIKSNQMLEIFDRQSLNKNLKEHYMKYIKS
jgi:ABC-2 type transport system ATP-binding protein